MNNQMDKKVFIEQLKEGDRFDELFLVKSARLAETRTGKPYLVLTVMDKSGELGGPVWDRAEELFPLCQEGSFIRLIGGVQSYREKLQLKVDQLFPVQPDQINPADFMAASAHDLGRMADELQRLVQTVENPFLRKLLNVFFKKELYWPRFQTAPAAKGIHHAYVGGLLEHSLSVAKLADAMAFHYQGVDRSLLLTGALLHDIGKLEELEAELGLVSYTDRGRLKGHLVIGSEMVAEVARKIKDFPQDLLEKVQHMLLSHHGRMEFGSPTVPMTVEAFILSSIDDLDAKMNLMEQLRRKLDGAECSWTDYQRTLERYLFLNGLKEDEPVRIEVKDPQSKQQTLF